MPLLRVGKNDIASKFPHLLEEWDFRRNTKRPNQCMVGSYKRAYWVCSNGHSYIATIASKTNFNRGCPFCSASDFEKMAHDIINRLAVEYECEYTPKDLSFRGRYDIHILEPEILIELDGIHHFKDYEYSGSTLSSVEDVTRRDNIKSQYAFDHKIPLLRIPYIYRHDFEYLSYLLDYFIENRVVPQNIISFYDMHPTNNYSYLAEMQNAQYEEWEQLKIEGIDP